MKRFSSLLFVVSLLFVGSVQAQKYVGGDISLLPSYEANGSKYRTTTGAAISDVITFSRDNGLNAMRVRLFVDPTKAPDAEKKEGVRQDLAYVTALGKRIKDAGLKFLLDFHYSDSWADPVKQYTPDAWVTLTDLQLYDKIYNYTKECLQTLKDAGAEPDFIQTGNEISYGMCWGKRGASQSQLKRCQTGNDANWLRFTTLLKNAIKACREECPQAKIIIHTERVANVTMQKTFYERLQNAELDYDIIGTSFYSYYHGSLQTLETSLNMLATNFPTKDIWLVEVGYFYNWQPTIKSPGVDLSGQYPITEAGQAAYTEALINVLNKHEKVKGLFWWMMEANEYKHTGSSQVTKDWYNAALWDDNDGMVNPAFFKLQNFLPATGIEKLRANDGSEASKAVYDLQGRKVADGNAPLKKGIYIRDGKKMILGE